MDYSPCDTCVNRVCKVYPATKFEPKEIDEYCTLDMSSFGSSEGCYMYETKLED